MRFASTRTRILSLAAGLLALLMSLGLFVAAGSAADEERGVLADVISRALSTPSSRVTIGRIEGALSSSATIHDIAIQDRDGVWLKLDRHGSSGVASRSCNAGWRSTTSTSAN